ncbi:hypothetical protein Leryth_013387 [Lithospermum erythrorhizon]|nr:hypothetical protein Leryth_013387 [Lithospermum erythrorhizon]
MNHMIGFVFEIVSTYNFCNFMYYNQQVNDYQGFALKSKMLFNLNEMKARNSLEKGTMKIISISALLLVALIVLSTSIETSMADGFCDSKCAVRCSKAGRQDRCLQYCGICCEKCHCVPSGTFGNKDECPCYRDMKNSKGGPKCP